MLCIAIRGRGECVDLLPKQIAPSEPETAKKTKNKAQRAGGRVMRCVYVCETAAFGFPGAPRTSSILFIIKTFTFRSGPDVTAVLHSVLRHIANPVSETIDTDCRPEFVAF